MVDSELATAEECWPLYGLLDRIREAAPWEWLNEDHLFAVIDPVSGEPGFVSIMGAGGDHYAVALYQGVRGLYSFLAVEELGPDAGWEDVLDLPHLQASLEDRDFLEKRDREQIKALGLKYRGRNAWPAFRSYRPGAAPYFIDKTEARTLAYALEQVLDVAPRLRENLNLLVPSNDESLYLVRVPEQTAGGLVWHDAARPFPPPAPLETRIQVKSTTIETVRSLSTAPMSVEIDCFRLPSVIAPRDERPYFPYALLMVDAHRGLPLGIEMLTPTPTLDAMWERVGEAVLGLILQLGSRPREILVADQFMFSMLTLIGKPAGLKVKLVRDLPALRQMAEGLLDYLHISD